MEEPTNKDTGANSSKPSSDFASAGGIMISRPESYAVGEGNWKKRRLNKAGMLVKAGLENLEDVKQAKLPHTMFNYMIPHPAFYKCMENFAAPVTGDHAWSVLSGVQIHLNDTMASVGSIDADDNDVNYLPDTCPFGTRINQDGNCEMFVDLDSDYGIKAGDGTMPSNTSLGDGTKYCLNAFNFPLRSLETNLPYPKAAGSATQTGHSGFRNHNYVSSPEVYVKDVVIELTIATNLMTMGGGVDLSGADSAQTFQNWLGSVGGLSQLDFRVLVIQNTDSFREQHGHEPTLSHDLLAHPMGLANMDQPRRDFKPMKINGVQNSGSGLVNAVQVAHYPTGWMADPDTHCVGAADTGLFPAWEQSIPNQDQAAYRDRGLATYKGQNPGVSILPTPDDFMTGGINSHAYRVLHDEKFSLGVCTPFNPSTLPAQKTVKLKLPIRGMMDIFGKPRENIQTLTDLAEDDGITKKYARRRPWGWDAIIHYQNAPRILIMCSPVGGRLFAKNLEKKTKGSELTDPLANQFAALGKTHQMWHVKTRGYTTYRDSPTPDVANNYPFSE